MSDGYIPEDGWMETYTGTAFHFGAPKPEEFKVLDIAHALSMLCRYNGHVHTFYSVAEHVCLIADWLEEQFPDDPMLAFTGLHHDDAEAYIGDMARPVKHQMTSFKVVEGVIEEAAAGVLGFTYPFPAIIKECDSRIIVDERSQACNPSRNVWGIDHLEPLGVTLRFWSPDQAREEFCFRHTRLTQRIRMDVAAGPLR